MGFETPKIVIDKVKKLATKGMMLAGLGTALLSTEGCKDKESQSKIPPKELDPIIEKADAKKTEHKFLNANEIIAREKEADDVVIGYLENLSNNNAMGDRMEMGDKGNIFIEIHGSFFELSKSDLLRLRSIVMRSELSPNASKFVQESTAKALKIKIDLDISSYGKKVTDPSVLPFKIKARYDDLESIVR